VSDKKGVFMQKLKLLIVVTVLMLLSACSFFGEVNNSLEYVNTATTHIETLNVFADEAPTLIQEAINNPSVRQELETKLLTLKQDIEEFINLSDIPTLAESVHQEFVNKNKALLSEINKLLQDGQLALDQLENSQLVATINDVTSLLNRIEELGL
jgi:hypothetical protein